LSYGTSYSRTLIFGIGGIGHFCLYTIILRVIWTIWKILRVPEERLGGAGRSNQKIAHRMANL